MREPRNWLKSLGFGRRGEQLPDRWDSVEDVNLRETVTFPQRPGVQPGDGLVLYAAGTGLFFAVGRATSWPYERDKTAYPWAVDYDLIAAVDHLRNAISLDELEVNGRSHRIRIKRRSHVNLTDAEFDAAVEALRNA